MISKLIKNGEDIFLQTTTDAVINSNNKTLSTIIQELEKKISDLITENENLKVQLANLDTKLTNGELSLNSKISSLESRVGSLESSGGGGTNYESRIKVLENKTQKLEVDGDFNVDIRAPKFFQK